jgi:DNA primase
MPVTTATPDPPGPQDIVEVVSEHTALRACGPGDLRGTCPFCGSPTFHCRPTHGTYHCYGCGEGGDARTFTTKINRPEQQL